MNTLKLKLATQDCVVYLYYPEGKGEPGEIRLDIGEAKALVTTRTEGDNTAEHYGYKAAKAVKECVDNNNMPLEFINAWY